MNRQRALREGLSRERAAPAALANQTTYALPVEEGRCPPGQYEMWRADPLTSALLDTGSPTGSPTVVGPGHTGAARRPHRPVAA
jgi:hypothetical protein